MAKRMKVTVQKTATCVATTRYTALTLEAIYFLTAYNLGPVMMWAKELIT